MSKVMYVHESTLVTVPIHVYNDVGSSVTADMKGSKVVQELPSL